LQAAGFGSFASKISGMLETTALACERGGLRLFSGLAFALQAGSLLRVRGANGSGKTTLLRTLAGLTRPAVGEVRWRGNAIGDDYRREMLFLGHAAALKDELTVLENLQFSARLADIENPDCERALQQLGVARLCGLPARYLSQGQRKRAALARLALSAGVPLWLLDEPFAALDEEAIARVSALCGAHLAAGGLLVLTSHQDVSISSTATQELDL
jgi:heme exporter protein A